MKQRMIYATEVVECLFQQYNISKLTWNQFEVAQITALRIIDELMNSYNINNANSHSYQQQNVRKNILGETNSLDSGSSPIVTKSHIPAGSINVQITSEEEE